MSASRLECRRVTRNRRLAALLTTAAFAAAPASAFAQGAGDDQYTDPLGTQTGSKSGSGSDTTSTMPKLSQSPQGTSTTAATQTTTPTTPAASASDELPATGADARLIALAGTGLLLMGAGLRLRLPASRR